MKNITTIFIDIDNTLLDFNLCAEDSVKKGFKEWNIPYEDAVFSVFTQINNSLWHKIEQGELTREELLHIRWQLIFDELGIDRYGPDFEKMFVANLSESHIPVASAPEIIKYLAGRYKVYVTSNAMHEQQVIRMKKAGMFEYITDFFTSESIGFAKPTKEFFDECFKKLPNTKKDEVIIIGDSITADIKGGIDYGIKTCWFNQNYMNKAEVDSDFTVGSLIEIMNFL